MGYLLGSFRPSGKWLRMTSSEWLDLFFARGFLLKELNNTDIALIPKVDNPTLLKNFRPISLCNVSIKSFQS